MRIDIITIFPQEIKDFTKHGIFRIAQDKGKLDLRVHDLRKWATDKHKSVDDRPYGGGAGMVMKIEPIYKAIETVRTKDSKVILTTPQGETLTQEKARTLSQPDAHYILICGHYEGVDERVRESLVDLEVSIGDYILSGGELPALVMVDVLTRLLPGVLGNEESAKEETFEDNMLEYPQYTRPEEFKGLKVPELLLTGDHEKIKSWREDISLKKTKARRPDLLDK